MQTLSLKRTFLIFRRNILLNSKSLLVSVGGVLGLVFFIFLIAGYHSTNMQTFHTVIVTMIIFVGGTIYTSQAFNDFSSKSKGIVYLTLPATRGEKLLEAFLRSLIIYPVAVILGYYLYSILLSLLGMLFFNTSFSTYSLFKYIPMDAIVAYLLFHSIFFLGALYFNRNAFLKTIFALFVLDTIIMLVVGLAGYIIFRDIDNSMPNEYYFENLFSLINVENYHLYGIIISLSVTVFLWIVAYIRLSEKQV